MNNLSLRIGLIGLTVAGAAAVQAYDLVNLRAQNTGGQMNIIQQGVKSVSLSGSIQSTNSNTNSQVSLMGSFFATGEIEVFGGVNYNGTNSFSNYNVLIGGRYYVGVSQDKQVLPFVGAFAGFGKATGSTNSSAFGAEVGIQYYLAPNVSFTPILMWTSSRITGQTFNTVGVQFGMTFWMK